MMDLDMVLQFSKIIHYNELKLLSLDERIHYSETMKISFSFKLLRNVSMSAKAKKGQQEQHKDMLFIVNLI